MVLFSMKLRTKPTKTNTAKTTSQASFNTLPPDSIIVITDLGKVTAKVLTTFC